MNLDDIQPTTRTLLERVEAGLKAQPGDDFERLGESLLYARACTSLSDEDATARMNLTPSGTSYGWQLCTDDGHAPVPCQDKPDTHRHLMWEC